VPDEDAPLARQSKPLTFARYVLLEPCGRGSRGMVYRAYDPQLDRKVAIKLLLASTSAGTHEAALLREARAMARVSHANIIAVYDVGSYDEDDLGHDRTLKIPSHGVFVVMELIEGLDLPEWLSAERRDWREIVRAFIEAGHGLAAAHEAGVVHRDFKPTNVRVASDGRIVVLDFGLARAVDDDDGRPRLIGTPMYMSPEQHLGQLADARSDQYSFAVALYEALVGTRPFTGTVTELAIRKHEHDWLQVVDGLGIPAAVWTILRRCVDPDPNARFASMTELLERLEACLTDPRRRWFALAGVPLALLTIAALAFARTAVEPSDRCSGADERVARVWNDEVRAVIELRLHSSGAGYADTTWAEVRRALDEYTDSWAGQYREACEATWLRGEQSEAALDLRMGCLARRLHEVEVVTTTLANADAGVVENAVAAVHALGWLGSCEDVDALRSGDRLPATAAARVQIEHGYERLSEALIIDAAGRYDDALALAEQVATQARELEHAPLLAAADLRRAAAFEGRGEFAAARQALLDALAGAEASRDDAVAADAWLRMLWVVGVEMLRTEEGEAWLQLAEAAVARLGDDPLREATLAHNRGGLRLMQGRPDLALVDYLAALDAQSELLGSSDPAVARTSNHIANTLITLNRYDEAWSYATGSLELRIATLGSAHPLVAANYNNMAVIAHFQKNPVFALALTYQALEIDAIHGTGREFVTRGLARNLHTNLGQFDEARAQILQLLALPPELFPSYVTHEQLAAELALLPAPRADR
jgi:tetratricopeptide (TPR) repeat protein